MRCKYLQGYTCLSFATSVELKNYCSPVIFIYMSGLLNSSPYFVYLIVP